MLLLSLYVRRFFGPSLASLLEDAPSDADRTRLRSAVGRGAWAWLTPPPIVAALQFARELFLIALRTRLGQPQLGAAAYLTCEGRWPLDALGVHLLRCPHGGGTTAAHDVVRDAVVSIASEADFRVGREQRHLLPRARPDGAHRRVDLLFTDNAGGRSLGDVVVADPTCSDHIVCCARPSGLGVAARLAASRKHRAYSDLFPGDAFRPLAVETYGCLDGPFDDFLRECARRAVASGTTSTSSSTLACFFRQRISVALQRA